MQGSHVEIAVIGAGFSGLATAVRLIEAGRRDFVVFERAPRVGGVWRDNTYPGCACDVPAHLYSLSFAQNPGWTNTYAGQAEILAYLEGIVARHVLTPYLRLSHTVADVTWDGVWHVRTNRGDFTAKYVVFAAGALSEPHVPDIPGVATFKGRAFHSARWNARADIDGKRIAVIGTGASAIQIIPEVQRTAAHVDVFQRTPPWVLPRRARAIGPFERKLMVWFPFLLSARRLLLRFARELLALVFVHPWLAARLQRLALHHLHHAVKDPQKRAALTPSYIMGCKRIVVSDDYYPAVDRENVSVITVPIREIVPRGIVTADGTLHELDVIVFATGFSILNVPIFDHIRGRGGVSLTEAWRASAQAYLGTTVAGFPNLFVLQGPNTGLGHTSVLIMIEEQLGHILKLLDHADAHGAVTVEPTREAQSAFVDDVQEQLAGTVWNRGGCSSWYLDAQGRNTTLWPGTTLAYARRMRAFDTQAYTMERPQ